MSKKNIISDADKQYVCVCLVLNGIHIITKMLLQLVIQNKYIFER